MKQLSGFKLVLSILRMKLYTMQTLFRHKLCLVFFFFKKSTIWSAERKRGRSERRRGMLKDEKKQREGRAVLKHNGSIHPLTSGELSPDDRAFPSALKSTFEDVLVHPWIHLLPIGGCSLGFVHVSVYICVCAYDFFFFLFFSFLQIPLASVAKVL